VQENGNGGKGMGLKNIAERTRILNGTLAVDSQPGRGTRIVVTIPIAEAG
jgi:signal transduction histidine kinase